VARRRHHDGLNLLPAKRAEILGHLRFESQPEVDIPILYQFDNILLRPIEYYQLISKILGVDNKKP